MGTSDEVQTWTPPVFHVSSGAMTERLDRGRRRPWGAPGNAASESPAQTARRRSRDRPAGGANAASTAASWRSTRTPATTFGPSAGCGCSSVDSLEDLPTALDLPNIYSICRNGVQAALEQQGQQEALSAHRRRERETLARQKSRQRAAAWRRSYDRRLVEVQQRMKAEDDEKRAREEERAARLREAVELTKHRARSEFGEPQRRHKLGFSPPNEPMAGPEPGPGPSQAATAAQSGVSKVKKNLFGSQKGKGAMAKLQAMKMMRLQRAGLMKRYEDLPEEERDLLTTIFKLHDYDDGGTLDAYELRQALRDFGLWSINAEEQRQVIAISQRSVRGREEGCDMYEFAADLVPAVRKTFMRLRHATIKAGLLGCERDLMSGELVAGSVVEIAKLVLPLELLDDEDTTPFREELMSEVVTLTQDFCKHEQNVVAFVDGLMKVAEQRHRAESKHQRNIQAKRHVGEALFREFRADIVRLDQFYDHADADHSGFLDKDEIMELFVSLGVVAKSSKEQREVLALMHDHDHVDFVFFLQLVGRTRALYESQDDSKVLLGFQRYAAEGPGRRKTLVMDDEGMHGDHHDHEEQRIRTRDVRDLLYEMGLTRAPFDPNAKVTEWSCMDKVAALAIMDSDPGGLEVHSYAEVRHICQCVQELSRMRALSREIRAKQEEAKQDAGFSEKEFTELRWAFDMLDEDKGGSLCANEVQEAMNLAHVNLPTEEHFRVAFRSLDADGSGALDFSEFITLMKRVRDKEGIFMPEDTPATRLADLDRDWLALLLELFHLPAAETERIMALSVQQMQCVCGTTCLPAAKFCRVCGEKRSGEDTLLDEVCHNLGLGAETPLEVIDVQSLGDLRELATAVGRRSKPDAAHQDW